MNPYIMTPHIIKETAEGTTYAPILDELFTKGRSVEVVGEITRESVYSLILQLKYLNISDPEKEITMYINSPGGSVTDGLALYDVMEAVKCPIRTVCVGMAASMGALLFAAGDSRDILPHAQSPHHGYKRQCIKCGGGQQAAHGDKAGRRADPFKAHRPYLGGGL